MLKHIGDQLASLLYGDGKTLAYKRDGGILGHAQMLLTVQHKLMEGPIRVYVPDWCVGAKYIEKRQQGEHYTDGNHYESIKKMIAHASREGVDIKMVVVEN